jgi:hypothetical protein
LTVTLPHREGRGDRGLLDNVQEMEGKVGVTGDTSAAGRDACGAGVNPAPGGAGARKARRC